MKRKIVLLSTLVMTVMGTYAQKVNFGIKAGLNISSLSEYEYPLFYEEVEFDAKSGLYAGVFSQIYFTKNLGIEAGLFYSQLGGKDKENDGHERFKITVNPAYIQLPVSVIYKFSFTDKLALYPSLGIYAGCGLSGKIKTSGAIGSTDISGEAVYFDDFARRFDFGGTAGLNLQFWGIALGFGYDRSFIRVNRQKVVYDNNAFNSNFRIILGYIF